MFQNDTFCPVSSCEEFESATRQLKVVEFVTVHILVMSSFPTLYSKDFQTKIEPLVTGSLRTQLQELIPLINQDFINQSESFDNKDSLMDLSKERAAVVHLLTLLTTNHEN